MTKRSHNDSLDGELDRPVYHRQNSVISRFESLRRQYSGVYYDPYQQEQVQQHKRKIMSSDEDRPTKRRKSFTSMVKSGVVQSVLFGSALALTAFDYLQATAPSLKRCSMEAQNDYWSAGKHYKKNMRGHGVDFSSYFYRSPTFEKRMQKTEQLIRDICLDQQYAFNQHFGPARDDLAWGLVNKDDYDVNFMTMPPPKPKRSFSYLQKQKNLFFDTA